MGFNSYRGGLEVGAGFTPIADFPLMQSCDIQVGEDGKTLAEFINEQGGGISAAIIDVIELPTEDIRTDALYRVVTGTFYGNGIPLTSMLSCITVNELPIEGIPVTSDMEHFIFYYEVVSNSVSGYVDNNLSTYFGVPSGWYLLKDMSMPLFGAEWGGIFYEVQDAEIDKLCLVLTYVLYQYTGQWGGIANGVGWSGAGLGSEVFNTARNIASGEFSHAEGSLTKAIGNMSHTEGEQTIARGSASHAQGCVTEAIGDNSHAEGFETIAYGENQHVQGKNNIVDTENKYAHIVGNGKSMGEESNAHTLDWGGTAWFAGEVKVGGTGQDDPNAKTLTPFTTNETLSLKDGVLSVNVASSVEGDNTLPISSAAVATTVGNIEILLKTI